MSQNITNLFLILFLSLLINANSSLKFNIPNNREKCFTEEIYFEGTILIRYDLNGINYIKEEQREKAMKSIKIFVKDPKGKIIKEFFLESKKEKIAIHVKDQGQYYICSKFYKNWSISELPKEVVLGIKIRTDYEYKRIENSLEKEDVNNFILKLLEVRHKVIPSLESSKIELDEEDRTAKVIISTSNLYFKLSIVQLILIIIIAFYQIVNVRKFLASKIII
jgi:hypothetical protein